MARVLFESLGGSLKSMYWDVENATAFATAELPDSVTAAAVLTAIAGTGSFATVRVHELLNQEQLQDALVLARSVSTIYRPPGSAAIDQDAAVG